MAMKAPPHPGRTIQYDCIEALGLTIAEAAMHLQVEEKALADICDYKAPITADMAIRFEMAFGSTAEFWLRLQTAHDLAQARKSECRIKRVKRAA